MHFDKQAINWDNDPQKVARARAFAKEINEYIMPTKQMNALEFGCGTGLLSFELKDVFHQITLVDVSVEMIKVLEQKIEKHEIAHFIPVHADLLQENMEFSDIDVLYTSMTLHHLLDLHKALSLFASILNDGGYLCIADLVKEDGSFHSHHPNFDGHNGFDKDELSSIMQQNGFEVGYYNEAFVLEKKVGETTRKYPLFLMICKKR